MTDLSALIERVESGVGSDRELDCLIWAALDGRTVRYHNNNLLARSKAAPHDECVLGWIDPGRVSRNFSDAPKMPPVEPFTGSIDAALSLIEAKLPGWRWSSGCFGVEFKGNCWSIADEIEFTAFGKSPARALLAAALRAIQESRNDR